MAELGLYVYGLVAAGDLQAAPAIFGVEDAPVRSVREGDVCALVSEVGLHEFDEQPLRDHLADMAWVEQTARRHQQVLDAVLGLCTPLPMRLCTLYADEDGLRQMLATQQSELSAALEELRGTLEWGVQCFAVAAPRAPRAEQQTAADSAPATGTDYLQRRLQVRRSEEQAGSELGETCERLHASLSSVALAARLGTPQRPEVNPRGAAMVLNAFYLVADEQREAFRARVAELHEEHHGRGLELELTGPWPPYNFVSTAVGGVA